MKLDELQLCSAPSMLVFSQSYAASNDCIFGKVS